MWGFARLIQPAVLAWGLLAMPAATANGAELSDFFGTYVGHADVEDLATGQLSDRDIDIVIEPFHDDGFQIHWITVIKVDGHRDVPGVRRTVQSVLFEPQDGQNFYVEVEPDNPFREREEMEAMSGKAIRWADIDGDTLHVHSFVVLEDGRYELQIYNRILTDIGLDIVFRRFDDGELVRQIQGETVRVEP